MILTNPLILAQVGVHYRQIVLHKEPSLKRTWLRIKLNIIDTFSSVQLSETQSATCKLSQTLFAQVAYTESDKHSCKKTGRGQPTLHGFNVAT